MVEDDIDDASSTTLVTFLYENLQAYTVDLLGSWDNFSRAYPMRLDTRRGGDQWTGCYSFDDIMSNGNHLAHHGGRSGGLRQGATYWYYYSLNGGIAETHNEAEPYTLSCPLLPGQCVNVLEVPHEALPAYDLRSDSNQLVVHTLDPQARYVNPRPAPTPKPSLPRLVVAKPADSVELRGYRRPEHPATAGGYETGRFDLRPAYVRRLHTAAASPTAAVKSAFSFIKGLDATTTWSEHSNGRSSNFPTEQSGHRVSSPSAPLNGCSNKLHSLKNSARGRSPPVPGSSAAAWNASIDLVHRRAVSDHANTSPKYVAAQSQGRSVSLDRSNHQEVQPISPLYTYSDLRVLTRSPATNRAPTLSRSYKTVDDATDMSHPRPERGMGETVRTTLPRQQNTDSGPDSSLMQPGNSPNGFGHDNPSLDKELPPLPADLIPAPLRIRSRKDNYDTLCMTSCPDNLEAAGAPQSRFSKWTINESRFSEWSTHRVDHGHALEFDEDESEDELSPGGSSINGEWLDTMPPWCLSDPSPQSLDHTLHRLAETDDSESTDYDYRPDHDTLEALRAAINNSGLPLHNTFPPQPTSPNMARTHERFLDGDLATDFSEITPTASTIKLHQTLGVAHGPLVAGDSAFIEELISEFDYLGGVLS